MDAEERADLATQVQSAGFESKDVQLILQFLVTTHPNGRRDAQDYTAFLEYVSSKEWDLIDAGSESEIDDISCQVLARLNCLNPCEQTKKMLTAADLVAVHKTSAVSDEVKSAKHVVMKSKYDKLRRRLKAEQKKPQGVKLPYIKVLPKNPACLKALSAELYDHANIEGCFVQHCLNRKALLLMESALSCRGHEARLAKGQIPTLALQDQPTNSNAMLQAMVSLQSALISRPDSDDLGSKLTFMQPDGKKRSLQAVFGNYGDGVPPLRRARTIQEGNLSADGGQAERPLAFEVQTTPGRSSQRQMQLEDGAAPPPMQTPPRATSRLETQAAEERTAEKTVTTLERYTPGGHAKRSADMAQ